MGRFYSRQDIEEVTKCYDAESLQLRIAFIEAELESTAKYLEALKKQFEIVKQMQFKHEVFFRRRGDFNGRVKYYVGVNKIPQVEDARPVTISATVSVFSGKEKKQAREYARKLAEEYGAEVVEE